MDKDPSGNPSFVVTAFIASLKEVSRHQGLEFGGSQMLLEALRPIQYSGPDQALCDSGTVRAPVFEAGKP